MKCIIKITSPAPRYAISSLSTLSRAILETNLEKDYKRFNDFTCVIYYENVKGAKKAIKIAWSLLKKNHNVTGFDGLRRNGEILYYDAASAQIIK